MYICTGRKSAFNLRSWRHLGGYGCGWQKHPGPGGDDPGVPEDVRSDGHQPGYFGGKQDRSCQKLGNKTLFQNPRLNKTH